jgi:hypothetical protein
MVGEEVEGIRLQAIWMINSLEDLYTRGKTLSEKQKIEYLWNFARDDGLVGSS